MNPCILLLAGAACGAAWTPRELDLSRLQDSQQRFLAVLKKRSSVGASLPQPKLARFLAMIEERSSLVVDAPKPKLARFLVMIEERSFPAVGAAKAKLASFLRLCSKAIGAAYCAQGDGLRERGKLQEALAAYQQVISRWPGTVQSRGAIDRILDCRLDAAKDGGRRARDSVVAWFRSFARRLGESDKRYSRFVLARFAYGSRDYSECEKALRDLSPPVSERWGDRVQFLLGLCQVKQGRFRDGAETLIALADSDPNSILVARATFLAGWACYFEGDFENALPKLQSVVRDHPESEVAQRALKLIERIEK